MFHFINGRLQHDDDITPAQELIKIPEAIETIHHWIKICDDPSQIEMFKGEVLELQERETDLKEKRGGL